MKHKVIAIFAFITILLFGFSDETPVLISGRYNDELNLAYNPSTNMISGFFESYTGLDESTGKPRFSCLFYLEGKLDKNTSEVKTYFPLTKADDMIVGSMNLISNNKFTLKLDEDHGGCWNVAPLAAEPGSFQLTEERKWIEIRYVTKEKSYFYSDKKESAKRKAYIVKGDIFYVERIEDGWAYGNFYIDFGKRSTTGWIKIETLNQF